MTDDLMGGDPLGVDVRPCASYTLRVNGFERPVTDAWIGESLLYVLRERLGLAGAKGGCEQGECGACSIQVDGQLVAGCLVPAALAADSEISTVEGLSENGPSDVQQALAESGAVQCGYCTPGLAMAVHDLLQRNHRPTEVEARQALCGNLCRCTGYRGVLAAVQTVADTREAALEAELAAAEAAAEAAGGSAADAQTAQDAAVPGDPAGAGAAGAAAGAAGVAGVAGVAGIATEQSVADLPLAGELPLYADSELWHEAAQPYPDQPTSAGAGVYEPAAYQPDEGWTAYNPTPPHGTVYDPSYETGSYPVVPPQPTGYDAAGYQTGSFPQVSYDTGSYPVPGYDPTGYETAGYEPAPAHGTAHDGQPHDITPAHGTYIPAPQHGTAYDGTTPAHGIRLPEDDHA
ncbi:2Fe-2S iron-sulfur cluster-binding protein [Kitasatospora camelliae]|uniref:(2Fe-2S)-binding protein n=1 Tax=Kitasatospora camelliae TaxID=3156397 RepID=UPI003B58A3DC